MEWTFLPFPFFLSLDHPREIVDSEQMFCCLFLQRPESLNPVQDHSYEYSHGRPSPQAGMGGSKGVRSPLHQPHLSFPLSLRSLSPFVFLPSPGWPLGFVPIWLWRGQYLFSIHNVLSALLMPSLSYLSLITIQKGVIMFRDIKPIVYGHTESKCQSGVPTQCNLTVSQSVSYWSLCIHHRPMGWILPW